MDGEARSKPRASATSAGLAITILVAAATMGLGLFLKQACALEGDAEQLCYSDLVGLYHFEAMDADRFPYIDACPDTGRPCDEYPVLTMLAMRAAAIASASVDSFFWVNAAILALAGVITAGALHRLVSWRALTFALSPALFLYAFINWDLLAVALTTLATVAFVRDRDARAGGLLGLGVAAKLYPGVTALAFALHRARARRAPGRLMGSALVAFAIVNLPFAIASPRQWATFYRFNGSRGPDIDSLWFVGCYRATGNLECGLPLSLVNAGSLLLFGLMGWTLWKRVRTEPATPAWSFALPLLVIFLLTNKVYSPQYSLWLLPWIALSGVGLRHVAAFGAVDVAVFVTRFLWLADVNDAILARAPLPEGAGLDLFHLALVARAVVLIALVRAWRRAPVHSTLKTREAIPA